MMSDAALVLRARGGDEEAFRILVMRNSYVYRLATRGLGARLYLDGDGGGRADLWQEALWGLHKAIRDWDRSGAPFKPFARMCMERQMVTAVKTARRKKHRILSAATSLSAPVEREDGEDELGATLADTDAREPSEILEERERVEALVRCVQDELTPLERQAVIRPADGLTFVEIAEEERCKVKSIDNARQRGQKKIARALEAVAA